MDILCKYEKFDFIKTKAFSIINNYTMALNKEVKEIEVDIPIAKINDLDYLQDTFLNVSFQLVKELSEHSDRSFAEMVNEFISDEACITETFLNKWGLSKSDINLKTKKVKIRKKKKTGPAAKVAAAPQEKPKKVVPEEAVEIKVNTEPEAMTEVVVETDATPESAVKVGTKSKDAVEVGLKPKTVKLAKKKKKIKISKKK